MKLTRLFSLCIVIYLLHNVPNVLSSRSHPGFDTGRAEKYLMDLGMAMFEKLKKYGISNLPDVDVAIPFNSSMVSGHEVNGTLYLEDGFVMDMYGIDGLSKQRSFWSFDTHVAIKSEFLFQNLTFVRTYRFEPVNPDSSFKQEMGTVFVAPKRYLFVFSVTKNLTTNEIIPRIESEKLEPGGEMLRFDPETQLTARLRQVYNGGMAGRYSAFQGLFDLWQPIFHRFLQAVTKEILFPELNFPRPLKRPQLTG